MQEALLPSHMEAQQEALVESRGGEGVTVLVVDGQVVGTSGQSALPQGVYLGSAQGAPGSALAQLVILLLLLLQGSVFLLSSLLLCMCVLSL